MRKLSLLAFTLLLAALPALAADQVAFGDQADEHQPDEQQQPWGQQDRPPRDAGGGQVVLVGGRTGLERLGHRCGDEGATAPSGGEPVTDVLADRPEPRTRLGKSSVK